VTPAKSLFHAFALNLAERLTRDNAQPDQAYLAMVSTIYSAASQTCPGEWVYMPQGNVIERVQSRERIAQALQRGEASTQIAQREGVDASLVRRIRRRGTIGP
jgi:hypothetical protein